MAVIGRNDLPVCRRRRRVDGVSRNALVLATVFSVAFAVPSSGQDRGRGAGPVNGPTAPPGRGRPAGPGYPKFFDSNMPFQPRDLAGIWTPNGNGFGGGGRCRDCGDRGFSMEFPVFTPAGQAAFDRNIPSYGRAKDSDDAKAHPEEHIGRRRAQPPALGQRHLRHLQSDGHAACGAVSRPRRIHRAAGSNPAALPVGLRPAHDLDGWTEAAVAGRRRHSALVGLCRRPLGGQHAGGRVHRLRRADVGRSLRLSAQRRDGAARNATRAPTTTPSS